VPRRLDPRSRTPAFKSVGARVRPVAARLVGAAGALETPRAEAALS
jgi:hypothetical protein